MGENIESDQEIFWKGKFGDDYIFRNQSSELLSSNIALFSEIMKYTCSVKSIFEIGPNIGMNLIALNQLLPKTKYTAIEINHKAFKKLKKLDFVTPIAGSILEFQPTRKFDFVFTKGVLIHLNPESLEDVYQKIYNLSNKYICIIEYYNPSPVTVNYRGHKEKLFKRDFAAEIMDKYSDLVLLNYGFCYNRDPNFPHDDITWFLMKKR
jgi:spore coat polysaccharide biosynthesis protein SpsF